MMAATITLTGMATASAPNSASRSENDSDNKDFANVLAGSVHGADENDEQQADTATSQPGTTDHTDIAEHTDTHRARGKTTAAGAKANGGKHAHTKHSSDDFDADITMIGQQSMAFLEGTVALTACTTPGGSISMSSAATTSAAISSAIDAIAAGARRTGQVLAAGQSGAATPRPATLTLAVDANAIPAETKLAAPSTPEAKLAAPSTPEAKLAAPPSADTATAWVEIVATGTTRADAASDVKAALTDAIATQEPQAHSTAIRAASSEPSTPAKVENGFDVALPSSTVSAIATSTASSASATSTASPASASASASAPVKQPADSTHIQPAGDPAVTAISTTKATDSPDVTGISAASVQSTPTSAPPAGSVTEFASQLAETQAAGTATPVEHAAANDTHSPKADVNVNTSDSAALASVAASSVSAAPIMTSQQIAGPAAPQAPAPTTQTSPAVANQVANTLIADLKLVDGEHRITVNLHPAELGAVQVIAHVVDGQIRVELSAAHHAGREALQAGLGDLDKSLKDHGFTGVDVSLAHSDGRDQQQASPSDRNAAQTARGAGRQGSASDTAQMDNPTVTPVRTIFSRSSLDRWL